MRCPRCFLLDPFVNFVFFVVKRFFAPGFIPNIGAWTGNLRPPWVKHETPAQMNCAATQAWVVVAGD